MSAHSIDSNGNTKNEINNWLYDAALVTAWEEKTKKAFSLPSPNVPIMIQILGEYARLDQAGHALRLSIKWVADTVERINTDDDVNISGFELFILYEFLAPLRNFGATQKLLTQLLGCAAEKRHPRSMFLWATNGLAKLRPNDVRKWIKRAARAGDPSAQRHYAYVVSEQKDKRKGLREMAKWLRRSARQGNPGGCFHLAELYFQGRGVPSSPIDAMRWVHRAVRNAEGDLEILRLSWYLMSGIYDCMREELSHAMSEGWVDRYFERCIREASTHGHGAAMLLIAMVPNTKPQDAVELLKKSAAMDYAHAHLLLGLLYQFGETVGLPPGIPSDAFKCYSKVFTATIKKSEWDFYAHLAMSNCYRLGYGVAKNAKMAKYHEEKAGKPLTAWDEFVAETLETWM